MLPSWSEIHVRDADYPQKVAAVCAAFAWAVWVSDFVRVWVFQRQLSEQTQEAEVFLAFGLWCLGFWWLSKRYGGGWNAYWFVFALVSFSPFIDIFDAAFGGALGLRTQN